MAENPLYEQQIAPPSTTGEILDNQSLGLIVAKNQAEFAARRNAAGAFMQLAGAAETIGDIFTRKNDLSQQQQMLSDLQQLDSEIGSVPENGVGGTGQLGNLNQNRNLLAEWETQEGGAESEYFQSWSEARLNNLGQGLRGKWRDAFEMEARNRLLKANMTIDSMATTHAYNGIKMANQEAMSTSIQNPNIDNIGSSIASSLGEMDGRLAIGIDAGIYTPQEAMEIMNNYENALLQSHYGAASRDIQDSDGWTDPTTGKPYGGLAGAEEMLSDNMASGKISEPQHAALRAQLYDEDNAKYARGSRIQSEKSNTVYNSVTQQMRRGTTFTQADLLAMKDVQDAINPEHHPDYNRVGDQNLLDSLLAFQNRLNSPTTSSGESSYPSVVADKFMDPTIDQDHWQEWLRNNWEKQGLTQDDMFKLAAKTKPTSDQLSRTNLKATVDAAFNPIIDSLSDDAEIALWEQRKNTAMFYLADRAAGDEIKTLDDVDKMMRNMTRIEFESRVFKDYTNPDRGTNDVETMGRLAELGYYRGVSGVTPEVALDISKMQNQQYTMTQNVYGADNVHEMVNGTMGSDYEGRVVFRITDPNDNKDKWVKVGLRQDDRGEWEEVWEELIIDEYDDAIGEQWTPSSAIAPEKVNPFEGALDDVRLPEPNKPMSVVDDMNKWYKDTSDGPFIPYETVENYLRMNYHSPEDTEAFLDNIYNSALPSMSFHLKSANNNGALGIFKEDGSLRWTAKNVMSTRLRAYGLPRTYVDRALLDIFGVE